MTFGDRVLDFIRQVPKGKVASYGQIAAMAGSPRAALIVGQILKNGHRKLNLPWQRIINSKGIISIVNMELPAELQAELLKSEGVMVERRGREYWVDLHKYGWQPDKMV